MSQTYLTPVGFDKLREEIENIRSVKIPLAEQRLITVNSYGNLREIKTANDEIRFYMKRVLHLQRMIDTAIPIGV